MNTFTTVFFVSPPHYDPTGLEYLAAVSPLPFILGLILLYSWLNAQWRVVLVGSDEHQQRRLVLFAGFFTLFGLCATAQFAGSYFVQRNRAAELAHLYEAQQYQMVEGPVHVLRLQPEGGHAPGDLIEIGSKQFEIDYYRETIGYRQTISNGGALTEGVYARVYFIDNTIIRVEVKFST